MSSDPHRLYRTYSVLGTRLNNAPEKLSISETELPDTLLLQVGEGPEAAEILINRHAWANLTRVVAEYNYSDFTWVRDEPVADADASAA